jgi:hypothetical protein
MPFGLCNAPSTFTTLSNTIFQEQMDDIVMIYIDDNLVYSKTVEDHAQKLEVLWGILGTTSFMQMGRKVSLHN